MHIEYCLREQFVYKSNYYQKEFFSCTKEKQMRPIQRLKTIELMLNYQLLRKFRVFLLSKVVPFIEIGKFLQVDTNADNNYNGSLAMIPIYAFP